MEEFIHRENLAIYKRRLAEPHTDAQHEILLRLQAQELAKESLDGTARSTGVRPGPE